MHKAIGDRLTCIFVDHGLLRLNEAEEVMGFYRNEIGLNVIEVNAKDRFLSKLAGVTEPERKRKMVFLRNSLLPQSNELPFFILIRAGYADISINNMNHPLSEHNIP